MSTVDENEDGQSTGRRHSLWRSGYDEMRLTEKTWVPVGVAVAALGACLVGAVWLNTSMVKINLKLETIERVLASQEGRWITRSQFSSWVQVLEARNPTLLIPKIE